MDISEQREIAWVGDAVLALWARGWILVQSEIKQEQRSDVFIAMTSNRFLSAFGEPTAVEAKIGDIYQREGLDAAFDWMNKTLLPAFKRQLVNTIKSKRGSKQ